jgi:NitT/TauT family transport system ATP-binding protein
VGPARIKGDYAINLARPRDVAEIRLDPEFQALYTRIWADLREEVKRSHEHAAG